VFVWFFRGGFLVYGGGLVWLFFLTPFPPSFVRLLEVLRFFATLLARSLSRLDPIVAVADFFETFGLGLDKLNLMKSTFFVPFSSRSWLRLLGFILPLVPGDMAPLLGLVVLRLCPLSSGCARLWANI